MPGLIAFRRRWSTGSDDFVVPSVVLFILHVTLFIAISIVIGTSQNLEHYGSMDIDFLESNPTRNDEKIDMAKCAHQIRNLSFGYLSLIALAAIIEITMAIFSMQGTVLDPEPRKPVEYILYLRIVFGIIEMAYTIASAVVMAQDWEQCHLLQDVYKIHLGIFIVNVVVFLVVLLVGYCVFDPSGSQFYKVQNAYTRKTLSSSKIEKIRNEYVQKSQLTWLSRLSNCFCCVSNNTANTKQVALDEVSALLSKFFQDYDLVLSDIIAGLTLLRHQQMCKENDTTLSVRSHLACYHILFITYIGALHVGCR